MGAPLLRTVDGRARMTVRRRYRGRKPGAVGVESLFESNVPVDRPVFAKKLFPVLIVVDILASLAALSTRFKFELLVSIGVKGVNGY